jgi:O-phosphoseryl-tRNA(Cys) synthetase
MYLSGWMRKEGIAFDSALKVIECIAADDEEKSARIRTLQETYKKQDLDGLSGYAGLLSILINQTQNEEKAKQILEQVKSVFPKTNVLKYSNQSITTKKEHNYLTEPGKNDEEENKDKKTNYSKAS